MPARFLRYAESLLILPAGHVVPPWIYVTGAVLVVLGLIMFYAGIRRFVRFSVFVWILGLLIFLGGLALLISPEGYVNFGRQVIFDRPENIRLLLVYIGGVLRILIGILLLIAAISPLPARHTARLGL